MEKPANLRDQLATYLRRQQSERSLTIAGRDIQGSIRNKGEEYEAAGVGDEASLKKMRISYGTAGFRGVAAQIEHLFFNVGLISGLKCLHSGANVGVMITASHNPVQDNGVKLIDSNGEMLGPEWELVAEDFCNISDWDELLTQLMDYLDRFQVSTSSNSSSQQQQHQVLIGWDTRPSSEALADRVKQGLKAWEPLVRLFDYGHVTTPALHYLVAESNKRQVDCLPIGEYYKFLVEASAAFGQEAELHNYDSYKLVVDCANGVGYETLRNLMANESFSKRLPLSLINIGEGVLNRSCGADFVKTTKKPPLGARELDKRYAVLDGDADRLIYFYLEEDSANEEPALRLLDGDKIMALIALYLTDSLKEAGMQESLSFGLVQTAYANGASTDFLKDTLGLTVECVDTGVKNLHERATQYDLGVYFEANGHGTIWISSKANQLALQGGEKTIQLKQLFNVVNSYVGDAISDIMVVETILRHYDWDIKRWFALYDDRPNTLTKVEVPDRTLIKTTDAGRTCISPSSLQSSIDDIVAQYGPGARSFVRASGTEDCVRVYAEANSQEEADEIAKKIGDKVISSF